MCRQLPPFLVALLCSSLSARAQAPRPLPSLAEATRIVATADGTALGWPELLDRLAQLDVVFLGETHVDDTTHRVELACSKGCWRSGRARSCCRWRCSSATCSPCSTTTSPAASTRRRSGSKARPWQNYHTAYRPLVEAAKAADPGGRRQLPRHAASQARRRRRQGGDRGAAARAARDDPGRDLPCQRRLLGTRRPRGARPHGRRRRRHRGERLYDTQNLWDNSMGDNVAKARAAHPDAVVLHVAGGFHVAYRDGTVAQFARRSPGQHVRGGVDLADPRAHAVRPDRDAAQADFLVYAEAIAREWNEGNYAVRRAGRAALPARSARARQGPAAAGVAAGPHARAPRMRSRTGRRRSATTRRWP
jgi:hypothetical protein